MEMKGSHLRYHPGLGVDSGEFVGRTLTDHDRRIAIATSLGSVFAPIMLETHKKLILERGDAGLILPDELPGEEPQLKDRSNPLFDNAYITLQKYPRLEFVQRDTYYEYFHDRGVGIRESRTFDINHPVGPYGKEFTLAMVNAMRALYMVVPEQLSSISKKVKDEHGELLDKYTYLVQPKYTVADSLKSTGEAFSFLTNDGLKPGFENDPIGLFRKLIETGAFEELSRVLVFSELAVLTRDGFSPKGILDPNTLILNPDIKKIFIKYKAEKAEAGQSETQSFRGCPVGFKNTPAVDESGEPYVIEESGVNLGARIFVEYLEHYYNAFSQNSIQQIRT